MNIRQLQVSHDGMQDRLLLRIATQANEEIRVWFTRRFLRELWPGLARMLGAQPVPQAAPAAGEAPQASFDQPFHNENPTFPLGANPLLASEATLDAGADGLIRMVLREGRERSFNLNLNGEMLQALCAMLRATGGQAKWDLALDYAATEPALPGSPPAGGSKRLH